MALLSVLLLLTGLTVAVQRWEMQRNLELLETTQSTGDLRRLLVSLDAQMLQVDALLRAWSNWTSLYEHAETPNPTFVKDELSAESLRVSQIDWLLRFTSDGLVADHAETPQPDGTTPLTANLAAKNGYITAFTKANQAQPAGCGTVQLSQHLAFICYRPLHNGSGGGAARGSVAIGRWISPAMVAAVREQTDLDFELLVPPPSEDAQNKGSPAANATITALLGKGVPTVTRMDNQLTISFPIISLFNHHIGEVRMQWPRRSVTNARASMEMTRHVLLAMLLGATAIIIVLVDRIVVVRLRRLKNELGALVHDRDWNGTISSQGQDEIAELATYTNGLMGVLRTQMLELRELSSTDTLTGLPNRRTFDARLAHVLSQYGRAKRQASLVLIDIDHFKRYNDNYGHPAGDAALQRLADCMRTTLRRQLDLPARLGGEEFAVVLDETPLAGAVACAETLRKAVLELAIAHTGNAPLGVLSISCGVATIEDGDTATSLYQRADIALYAAKESGRNQVGTGS